MCLLQEFEKRCVNDLSSPRATSRQVFLQVFVLLIFVSVRSVQADPQDSSGTDQGVTDPQSLPLSFEGPPPPVAPAVVSRDASGRATLRSIRLAAPLSIDGRLDEPVYADTPSVSDFIQNDPAEGEPATEKTEVWLFFDLENVYVVARWWESRPDRVMANEMRRDNTRIVRDDNFAWMFDTFYDRRNG